MEVKKVPRGFEIPKLNMKIIKTPQGYKIEDGITSEENYIRIGDLQICWDLVLMPSIPDTGERSKSFIFPVAFKVAPVITASIQDMGGLNICGIGTRNKTTTGADMFVYIAQSGYGAFLVGYIATGKWK